MAEEFREAHKDAGDLDAAVEELFRIVDEKKMLDREPGELDGIKRSKPFMDDTPEPEGAP